MQTKDPRTLVFIHGLFMNPKSWQTWMSYFEAKGYRSYAPSYPFHEGEPSELRKDISPQLARLTFEQVIASLVSFIDKIPEQPIFIGHSMGGLAVQRLIELGKGAAGICIDTAPPKGIFTYKWSFIRANLPTVNPLKGDSVFLPSVSWYRYAFCNTMSLEQTEIEYNKFVVPESRKLARSSASNQGKVDFMKPHKPLLFIAGEKDHIVPSSLNKKNFEAYKDTGSRKDFRQFPGRTHYICGQPNWEEIAQYCLDWITGLKGTS
jgi:pimeloyl-ACP methyl ester carboxylesterase